ncbi:hypothetical protein CDO73_01225 [Saccharibacillus sp. O23]|uniref:hypothetical protein n=1 Tax=Saccharibacillus sp. O23 TaxID=2009338 RepID=UPI000B4E109A|nr:hypothetical protein [Saccharibacillus sp. O23]OWR33154.1 hypothetical protein CDO73_01225 [Saccharibacillus sp. O23]
MNLKFWNKISAAWYSVREEVQPKVDLNLVKSAMFQDVQEASKHKDHIDKSLELTNDNDFWGGL